MYYVSQGLQAYLTLGERRHSSVFTVMPVAKLIQVQNLKYVPHKGWHSKNVSFVKYKQEAGAELCQAQFKFG